MTRCLAAATCVPVDMNRKEDERGRRERERERDGADRERGREGRRSKVSQPTSAGVSHIAAYSREKYFRTRALPRAIIEH